MDISAAPGGAAEPQGQFVKGGCQLPSDRGGILVGLVQSATLGQKYDIFSFLANN